MEYRPGSMGVAAPGFYMAVVDKDGKELQDGEEGARKGASGHARI